VGERQWGGEVRAGCWRGTDMWGRVLEIGDTGLRRGLAAGPEEREDVAERSKRARK
jgi:hypothetical protein